MFRRRGYGKNPRRRNVAGKHATTKHFSLYPRRRNVFSRSRCDFLKSAAKVSSNVFPDRFPKTFRRRGCGRKTRKRFHVAGMETFRRHGVVTPRPRFPPLTPATTKRFQEPTTTKRYVCVPPPRRRNISETFRRRGFWTTYFGDVSSSWVSP